MGGRFSRKRDDEFDPMFDSFYPGMPPPYGGGYPPPYGRGFPPPYGRGYPPGYGAGYGPGFMTAGFDEYDPYDVYGYGYPPTDPFETYGGRMRRRSPFSMGPYGREFNQMSPLNYGNFYVGNTTMQMIPYMKRKIAKYEQNLGMGSMGGGIMPMMPMMPCLPASCCMPSAAPMIAAAMPLPIAFNPLVQGMYPMASMTPFSMMSPSSFMSALSMGPMAYQPPPSFQFPSNVGMVMPVPCGIPNPLLTPPTFGGFSPQYNLNGGLSCCCCFCTPSIAPPTISYYPRPVSVPQPCPVPYPAPVPIVNVQQVPIPRHVSVVAPPIIAGNNLGCSIPAGAPLLPSQGGFSQGGFAQPLVMASKQNSTEETLLNDETSENSKRKPSISKSINQTRRLKAQQLAASLSYLGINNNSNVDITFIKAKNRINSNRSYNDTSKISLSNGKTISNSDWLTSDTLSSLLNKSKQNRHKNSIHHHKISSDHNCVICKQEQLNKLS